MLKYPKYEHIESVLDLIDEKDFCTRGEVATKSNTNKAYAGLAVGFLTSYRLVEERKDNSHGHSGSKSHKIYTRYKRCIIVIDLSSNVWRCVAVSLCKKITPIVEREYSFDMDCFDNLNQFLSDAAYVRKRSGLPHVMFVVLLLPSVNGATGRMLDVKYKMFRYPYPGSRPMLERVKSFAGKISIIPITQETAVSYCLPRKGAYISASTLGVNAFFATEEEVPLAKPFIETFADEWNRLKLSSDKIRTAVEFFDEMKRAGFSNLYIDFDSIDPGTESKIVKEANKIRNAENGQILAVSHGYRKLIYILTLRLSLRMYVSALMEASYGKADKKRVFRVTNGVKNTD